MAPSKKGPTQRGLTDEEKAAMREAVRERAVDAETGESAALAAIAKMSEPDRTLGRRVHDLVKASAPTLSPKTWYGMPAYAKDDKVICFFQPAQKFKTRYATLGFSDKASLDEGDAWPVVFAVKKFTPAVEAEIGALVKKAVS